MAKNNGLTELRKRAGAVVIDGAFRSLAKLGRLHPRSNPASHGVRVESNVAYGSRPEQRLDVYRPREHEASPTKTMLYIHGGGFRILSKDTHWVFGLGFARRGFTVFSIDYRLAPKHPFPAAIEDTFEAFAWIIDHAREYNADLSKLVIAGESAGANLALALSLSTCFRRPESYAEAAFDRGVVPKVVLPMCGILQVSDTERLLRRKPTMNPFVADRLHEVEHGYLGAQGVSDAGLRQLADPIVWLEGAGEPERPLPAMYTAVGTKDPLLDDSRRLTRELERRNVRTKLSVFPGELHAFHAFVWRPSAQQCWDESYSFLDALL